LELGGAQRVTLYVTDNLNRNNFDVTLICGTGGILDEKYKNKPYVKFSKHLRREISPVNDFFAFIEIYKMLKKLKPHIVHTNSSKAGIIGRAAAHCAGVKHIVHTVHGFAFNKIYQNNLYVFLERLLAKITEKIITVTTEDTKKGLSRKIGTPEKYITIRAGIDIAHFAFAPKQKNDKPVVTTIGSFKPQKNVIDFVRVAALIPDTRFLVVGDGVEREKIEKTKTANVTLFGWRNDIAEILSRTDIFVMTTLLEGLPCAAVEALVLGIPVVTYAIDGLKEIIKNNYNGFLVEPFNYKQIAEKINYLIENTALREEMSLNAKRSIGREFDIKTTLSELEKLYAKLC
jgi:glycosyltransferase involved in cell wall biosynthesis